ncbi:N-acetylmuramoyl-L-alanine amidase [Romboutsia sp.]|uniref:N-acetylmuramoyl-L-alanine amidase family protein n=1 Tax=Romboutsia sp. TaxID=1965302 RepID=UPI002C831DC1|nr:N-acetylmuramoyl-L-alanine amidase [Romboutsia sp.]HSQ87285.1 N-acetylmuramoyl-L-alanine amidase [Romboutsia sp.]
MSYKKNPNNRCRSTRLKKRKLNKKKLVLLICVIGVFIFGINKAALGVSQVVKNIDNMKKQEIEKQKVLESEKQFNIEEEQKDGLDKKYTVLIDPGHGGKDPGNLGYSSKKKDKTINSYEKDLTLEISKKVAGKLSNQNDVQVVITRSEDKFVSLEDRTKMANSQEVDALVSIHMNAETVGNTAYGIETYYRSGATDKSQVLAKVVQETIGSYIKIRDRGVKEDIFQLLRDTKMPAILVECGFITNEKEEQKLLDEQYQNQLAEGISQGVLVFLDEHASQ